MEMLGKFRLGVRLGAGAMGEVWKAFDTELNRWVALKFLKGRSPDELARFRREASMAAGLSHPNIAAVYDFLEQEGRPFIVMQLIEGGSLAAEPAGDARRMAAFIRDAARAAHFAHLKGIIHRDLKPDNLMVDGSGRLFVMDFGLARPVEGRTLSSAGLLIGTPAYMAPEQARGDEVGPLADVWALGISLHERITGKLPFQSNDICATLSMIQEAEVPRTGVDGELDTILGKCLEKDARRRYASAAELADDLDRWLEGRPILARPPSMGYRSRKWLKRHPAASGAMALMVVALLGVAAWAGLERMNRRERFEALLTQAARQEAMSQFQTAHDAYRDARALVPSDGRAVEGLARMQAALKRLDAEREKATAAARALQLVEEAGRKLEAAERLLYDRGSTIEEIVRRAEEARDVASRADLPQARRIAGRAILLKGDEAGAEAEFRKAGDTARLDLARLLVLRVYAASVGVSDAEREARRPERNRLAAEAERVLVGAVVENDLDRVLVRGMLAFVTMKEMEAARADLSAALGRFGESAGTEYLHWIAAVMAPKASKRAHVEVALRIRPKFPEALFVRAALRTDAGELGGAVEDCDALLELRPDHLDGLFNRGVARLRQRDFAKAEADFTRVIELDPRGAEGHYKRGLCRHARKDAAGAVADFTAAIERDPGHRWALAWRAVSRVDSGSYTDGEADADACLAIEGGNTIALSARGRARLARGAKEAAAADFYVAGTIVAEKGDHAGAVLLYSDAVGAHPSPSVHAARALSRTRLDDRKGAIEDYRRSLEIAPADWPLREKVEKILRSLESE